jgi:hypothetical protein
MARSFKPLVVSLVAALLFLASCQEEKTNPTELVLSDLRLDTVHTAIKRPSGKGSFYFDSASQKIYRFIYNDDAHYLTYQALRESDVDTIFLPKESFSPYGLMGLCVHNFDSIFFVPDFYGKPNVVFLYNRQGEQIAKRTIGTEHFLDETAFTLFSYNIYRARFTYPYFLINVGFHNIVLNKALKVVEGDFHKASLYPNHAAISFEDSSVISVFIPNEFGNQYEKVSDIYRAGTATDVFVAFNGSPILSYYQYTEGDWPLKKQLDLREVIEFTPFLDREFDDFQNIRIETDGVNNLIYDPSRELLYVFIRTGIPILKEDGINVATFIEKPLLLLVFDKSLTFKGVVSDWKGIALTPAPTLADVCGDHLVLPNYKYGDRSDSTTFFLLDLNDLEEKLMK